MKKMVTSLLCFLLALSMAVPTSASVSSVSQSISQSHLGTQAENTKAKKILMVGNSYTWYHHLDEMVENICTSAGVKAEVTSVAKPGASLKLFSNTNNRFGHKVYQLLKSKKWDYVILQDRHFYPISSPDKLYDAVLKLQPYIEASGAQTVLFMTWAPDSRCKDYETFKYIVSGRTQYQSKIKEVYETTARDVNAIVVPAGLAVLKAEKLNHTIPLLRNDGSHPTYAGSYVTACTIFKTLFPDAPEISYKGKLQNMPKAASTLLRAASETVSSYKQPAVS